MPKKTERKIIDQIFIMLGSVAVLALLTAGVFAWWGYNFATTSVKTELTAQKIYFPPAGSPGLNAEEFPDLQKYGGQQVTDGVMAKAYANGFIGRHIEKIADGKTYAEISNASMKDPTNAKLQQQKNTLFQGETLRGILLGTGYAFWTFGMLAKYAAIAAFIGAAIMAVLVWMGTRHLAKLK